MVAEKQEVIAKLRDLEREYHRLAQNPSARRLDEGALEWFWDWISQKPPFRPGDDVWTRMEESTRSFVLEMTGRH